MKFLLNNRFDLVDATALALIWLGAGFGFEYLTLPVGLTVWVLKAANKKRVLNEYQKLS